MQVMRVHFHKFPFLLCQKRRIGKRNRCFRKSFQIELDNKTILHHIYKSMQSVFKKKALVSVETLVPKHSIENQFN